MIAFQGMRTNGGGGGGTLQRRPIAPAPPPAVKGTVARPVSTAVPKTGNPIINSLLAKNAPRSGAIVSPVPVRGTIRPVQTLGTPAPAPKPVASSPIYSPPVGGPVTSTIYNTPVAPTRITGAPVSDSVPVQNPSSLGLAAIPPSGAPPSITLGNASPAAPDMGSFSIGGPMISLSGFQMNQGTVLLIFGAGILLFFLMAKR